LVAYNIITADEYNTLIDQTAYDIHVFLNDRKLEVWEGLIVATVDLSWTYTDLQQLKDFQIYRSAEGSAVMLYKTISVEEMPSTTPVESQRDEVSTSTTTPVESQRDEVSTSAATQHKLFQYTDEDVFKDRRYFYQVMARHTDGGFSEISNPKMVKVPDF